MVSNTWHWLRKKLSTRYIFALQLALTVIGAHLALITLWSLLNMLTSSTKKQITISSRQHAVIVSLAHNIASKGLRGAQVSTSTVNAAAEETQQKISAQAKQQGRVPAPIKAESKKTAKKSSFANTSYEVEIGSFTPSQLMPVQQRKQTPIKHNKKPMSLPSLPLNVINTLQNLQVENIDNLNELAEQVELDAAELLELERISSISMTIASVWRPPHAVIPAHPCIVEITLDKKGRLKCLDIVQSSGTASYDASIRLALSQIAYPSWLWGETTSFTFGE